MSGLLESRSRLTWAMSSFGASSAAAVALSSGAGWSGPAAGLVTRFRLLMTAQLNRPRRPQPSFRAASRSADDLEHRVDRAMAPSHLEGGFDRAGDELLGQEHRPGGIAALRQLTPAPAGKHPAPPTPA